MSSDEPGAVSFMVSSMLLHFLLLRWLFCEIHSAKGSLHPTFLDMRSSPASVGAASSARLAAAVTFPAAARREVRTLTRFG